jgi:predicted transcriptional regulator
MASVTVRVTETTHRALERLARRSGRSLQATLAEAVEAYRRQRLLEEANEAFAALRVNARSWEAEETERRLWDVTIGDGRAEDE